MNVDELLKTIDDAIASKSSNVYLSIPEPPHHNGYRVRLFGTFGPYATVISGTRGRLNVWVNAKRLKAFIKSR
jgi:hypothetical protein